MVLDLGSLGNALVFKGDGTTIDLTRDLGAAIQRLDAYNPTK